MVYNETAIEAAKSFHDITIGLNVESAGILGIVVFFVLWICIIITWTRWEKDFKEVFLFSSVVITILGVLMWAASYLHWKILILPIICVLAGIMVYQFSGS